MAHAAEAAMAALSGHAEADSPQTPGLQVGCNLARQCIRARYSYVLQAGYSPHVLRAAGRVDQILRGNMFRWLRNTTGASSTSVALFLSLIHI
eukprot:15321-Alexandrium_andersonii.AAC.1